jgi:hypothetical protein
MSVFNPQLFQDKASLSRQSDDAVVMAWLAMEERAPCLRDLALAALIGGTLTLVFSLIG